MYIENINCTYHIDTIKVFGSSIIIESGFNKIELVYENGQKAQNAYYDILDKIKQGDNLVYRSDIEPMMINYVRIGETTHE